MMRLLEMYDEKGYKREFLKTITNPHTRTAMVILFNKFEAVERSLDKDIAELGLEKPEDAGTCTDARFDYIIRCLSCIKYTGVNVLSTYKSRLNAYIKFYCRHYNQNPEENIFDLFTDRQWQNFCTKEHSRYLKYEEIKELEEKINSDIENPWFYNAVLFGCFYGFDVNGLKGFLELRQRDVDFAAGWIRFEEGAAISLADKPELKKYLREVIDRQCEYSLSRSTSHYEGKYKDSVFKVRRSSRKVRKDYDPEAAFRKAIRENVMDKMNSVSDRQITVKMLYTSGLLYYLVKKLPDHSIHEWINGKRGDKKMDQLQQFICEYGSNLNAYSFKRNLKDYIADMGI